MAPAWGQSAGGRGWLMAAFSSGSLWYSTSRSTEFMLTSSSVVCRTIQASVPVRLSADVSARPASPALRGTSTLTATAHTNTTTAPVSSSRMLSQRLSSWMGHHARLLCSMWPCRTAAVDGGLGHSV
eukprot:GHRQ01019667.1.p1 GENE.GHRQ01019667.1~~GHRQ01019667.1.p1  ORF type:complete len:127 (-),score=17.52 GHRQ01019667.1:359-739(-)